MLKNIIKIIAFYFLYCLLTGLAILKISINGFGYGDNMFLFERLILLAITIVLLVFYGYFSKMKHDKSFIIGQVIIFLIVFFSTLVSIENISYYTCVIYQSTPHMLTLVPKLILDLCSIIIEPFSLFIWISARSNNKNYLLLLISVIPIISVYLGVFTNKIISHLRSRNKV